MHPQDQRWINELRRPAFLLGPYGFFDLPADMAAIAAIAGWCRTGKAGFPPFHRLRQP
jgi:hypothetical protein